MLLKSLNIIPIVKLDAAIHKKSELDSEIPYEIECQFSNIETGLKSLRISISETWHIKGSLNGNDIRNKEDEQLVSEISSLLLTELLNRRMARNVKYGSIDDGIPMNKKLSDFKSSQYSIYKYSIGEDKLNKESWKKFLRVLSVYWSNLTKIEKMTIDVLRNDIDWIHLINQTESEERNNEEPKRILKPRAKVLRKSTTKKNSGPIII